MNHLVEALRGAGFTSAQAQEIVGRTRESSEDPEVLTAWIQHLRDRPSPSITRPFTPDEALYFATHSGVPASSLTPDEAEREIAERAVRDEVSFFFETYSDVRTSSGLGVPVAEIRKRVDDGLLSGYSAAGQYRLPKWQFRDDPSQGLAILPGVPEILAADPADIDPRSLAAFMTLPSDSLDDDAPKTTCADFLRSGGDVSRVLFAKTGLFAG